MSDIKEFSQTVNEAVEDALKRIFPGADRHFVVIVYDRKGETENQIIGFSATEDDTESVLVQLRCGIATLQEAINGFN